MNHSKLSSMPIKSHLHIWGRQLHLKESPNSEELAQRFTGKERDRVSGLDYFPARYYDSDVGYWLSPDAARQFGNLYSYGTNPLNSVDPDGNEIQILLSSQNEAFISRINSLSRTQYTADENGFVSASNSINSFGSPSYSGLLNFLIADDKIVGLAQVSSNSGSNYSQTINALGGGGTTWAKNGNMMILVNGDGSNVNGSYSSPSQTLMHEFVHAFWSILFDGKDPSPSNPIQANSLENQMGGDLLKNNDDFNSINVNDPAIVGK